MIFGVEISIMTSPDGDYEHDGYYDSIDEAIASLLQLKESKE